MSESGLGQSLIVQQTRLHLLVRLGTVWTGELICWWRDGPVLLVQTAFLGCWMRWQSFEAERLLESDRLEMGISLRKWVGVGGAQSWLRSNQRE